MPKIRSSWALSLVIAVAVLSSLSCADRRAEERSWYELGMMSDPILDQVLLFYLGEAWTGMTDINECLETAARVDPGDPESWAREWRKTAERLHAEADRLLGEGHRESAGEYYLRAASYYRATMHRHMHPGSAEVKELTEREIVCFVSSQELLGAPMEVVGVPYEGIQLTGYLYRSPGAKGPAPVLIVHQGRDAWAEDCKYLADEAVRRGYHCLLIDGPGNGQALRRHDLAFRPDWEAFVSPTVDYLVGRPEVDPEAIMLMGLSMGGFLAPRAAAHEPRLRICIANPGVVDWGAVFFGQLESFSPQLLSLYRSSPKALNAVLGATGRLSPFLMWGLTDTMWKHGAATPAEMLDKMKGFTNVDGVRNITATTLVVDAEAEEFGQSKMLYDALSCETDYMMFTEAEAAPLHVQTGSLAVSSQRIFDWIDDQMGRR
ncbi:MAG: alpha/beta fold hydrolase [Spirochaetales bacterium]|nr:alpha/beta fold hydrolase [Spirochaetales bacterium]